MADVNQIKLPNGDIYTLKDEGALQLTGGNITGPVSFGDSVSIDEATVGDLVVNGNGSFTNNLQVNTINGVAVGSSPKFTDNNTTYSAGTGLSLSSTTFSVKLGYTTSGNNRAVQADSSGNLYVTQKDDNTNTFKSFYGTCETAAATAAKVVTLSTTTGWQLAAGTVVGVKFTNTNTFSATADSHVTLNVNSTGAKNIYYANALPTGTNTTAFGRANYVNYYMYDGTNWVWLSSSTDNNTTYSSKAAASGGTDVSLCTTGEKYTWNAKTSNTGTVTSITLTQGTGISIGSSGTAITTSGSRTISLATITKSNTTSTASPAHGGTFTAIDSITYDDYGRVTAVNTKTITLPASENTDTKVTISNTNPTSGTWYYPTWYTATSGTGSVNANDGLRYYALQGTASAVGHSYIQVGNGTAEGTAGNKRGHIRIYNQSSGYTDIVNTSSASNFTITLPATTGTVALTSNLPSTTSKAYTNFTVYRYGKVRALYVTKLTSNGSLGTLDSTDRPPIKGRSSGKIYNGSSYVDCAIFVNTNGEVGLSSPSGGAISGAQIAYETVNPIVYIVS